MKKKTFEEKIQSDLKFSICECGFEFQKSWYVISLITITNYGKVKGVFWQSVRDHNLFINHKEFVW